MGSKTSTHKSCRHPIHWFKEIKCKMFIMLYNPPVKGEDGLYFVKALTDEKRKCLVQVNNVKVVDVSGEFVFDLSSNVNIKKIVEVDTHNLEAAVDNCETWFSRKLSENVITTAYTPSHVSQEITGDLLDVTKVYNSKQEVVDITSVQPGKVCDVILEFAGLWFAKKNFGPSWNVVQVRVHEDPILDTYPEGYAFVDSDDQ